MKTSTLFLLAVPVVLIICIQGCNPPEKPTNPPTEVDSLSDYRENQMIVIYKNSFDPADQQTIKDHVQGNNIHLDSIQRCGSCNSYMELWHGENIHTIIHADGVSAGSGLRHNNVGEDELAYYSVNYNLPLPFDTTYDISENEIERITSGIQPTSPINGADTIVIAVLDTGFEPFQNINSPYLWTNPNPDVEGECYPDDDHGWNFVVGNNDIMDDNLAHLHGTFVTHFIINEFTAGTGNVPQIMTLKTHDRSGSGSLFHSICAVHYAIDHGANIINASWGFYDYKKLGHPYFDNLITEVLPREGILFITAAGNMIPDVDNNLLRMGVSSVDLRDISENHFYPARLNIDGTKNIFVVTTTNATIISLTQNYSKNFVDFGVIADNVTPNFMHFKLPNNIPKLVSGSSYATAIFTGKIGAYLPKNAYQPNIDKTVVLSDLQNGGLTILTNSVLVDEIRDGKYVKR